MDLSNTELPLPPSMWFLPTALLIQHYKKRKQTEIWNIPIFTSKKWHWKILCVKSWDQVLSSLKNFRWDWEVFNGFYYKSVLTWWVHSSKLWNATLQRLRVVRREMFINNVIILQVKIQDKIPQSNLLNSYILCKGDETFYYLPQ